MLSIKYVALFFMAFIVAISSLLYIIYDNEIVVSISILIIYFFSVFLVLSNSPDITKIKLSFIYLLGFGLFICGRFISNIFGMDSTFCFEFGYMYCLNQMEVVRANILISSSLIFFTYGFISSSARLNDTKNRSEYFNSKILYALVILGLVLGGFTLYNSIQSVYKAINFGYLALYSNQVEEYSSPIGLIVTILFNAILALCFSFRDKIPKFYFFILFILFILNLLISVLAGSRANFVSALLILTWFFISTRKVSIVKVITVIGLIFSVFLTNFIASLSGARSSYEENSTLYKSILEDIFYNQGITMMVFNMGAREDSYPIIAYIKTIIPGSQIIYSWFYKVYQFDLSFSQYLMYKISPNLFYEGYGLAWSLLGDFYAFSFGFIGLFFFYNFIWGRILFKVSSSFGKNQFYNGMYFCFLISIFIINRFSISSFLVLISFYFIIYKLVKVKWGSV